MTGSEGVDFLQRLSTNDMLPLRAGNVVTTVLTTEKGRVIDVCTLVPRRDDHLLLTSKSQSGVVKSWLEKFIIMEDLAIEDLSSTLTTCCLVGPKAKSFLMHTSSASPEEWNRPIVPSILHGHEFLAYTDTSLPLPTWHAVAGTDAMAEFVRTAEESGAAKIIGQHTFDVVRVENGLPLVGVDITGHENPLESPLRAYVSFTKGCYIGQEVIARIETYKKLQKELRGMIIDAPQERALAAGELLTPEGAVGHTTSHAWSSTLGRHVALGYVKTGSILASLQFRQSPESEPYPVHLADFPLC